MRAKLLAIVLTAVVCSLNAGTISWDFTQDQPDWNKSRHLTAIGSDQGLELNIAGYDSNIGNNNTDIDPVKYPLIKIVYSASGLPTPTNGEIFFTGERTKTFGKAGYFRVPPLIVDGKEHTLILNANKDLPAGGKMWFSEKRIKQLRLDLVNQFPGKIMLKKVEFLPAPETEKVFWDFTKKQKGWNYRRNLTMLPSPKGLQLEITGKDSQIGNNNVNIDCKVYTKVKIVYIASGFSGKTSGELYFAGAARPQFSDGRNFIIPPLVCDGKEHTLILDINKNIPAGARMWNNEKVIRKLRLDLVNQFPGKIILKSVEFLPALSVKPISSLEDTNIRKGYFLQLGESGTVRLQVKPGDYNVYLYGAVNPQAAIADLQKVPGFSADNSSQKAQVWFRAGSWQTGKTPEFKLKLQSPCYGILLSAEKQPPQVIDPQIPSQVVSEVQSAVSAKKYLPFDENMPYWQSCLLAAEGQWFASGSTMIRREFTLSEKPQQAFLQITADDQVDEIYINGKKLRGIWTQDWKYPSIIEVGKYLEPGKNLLAVKYTNNGNIGGLMYDLTVNFADRKSLVIAGDGSEKALFKGNEKNYFAKDLDCRNWSKCATRKGPPYAPYSSHILSYKDFSLPRGSYSAAAEITPDNRRENLQVDLTFTGTPAIGDDEIIYGRLYPAKRTIDTQPISFISRPLKEYKNIRRNGNSVTVLADGFILPEFGGAFEGTIEYGIYSRKSSTANSIKISLPENPYPARNGVLSVKVDKSGFSPIVKVNGKPFYPTFMSVFYPKYPTGMEGKNSPVKVREFLAGGTALEWWMGPGQYDFTRIDERICQLLREYPDSYIAAWVWCQPPHWYDKLHPERISIDSKGKVFPYYVSTVTFSDPEYRKDAANAIKAFVEHCEKYFGNRMFAYNMAGGISLEWQGWGCHSMGQRKALNDYSPSAQRDFVKFAAERYPELGITQIPSYAERTVNRGSAFRDPVKDLPSIIYEEYYSESVADCIAVCAAAAKQGSSGNRLVGAYYGYYFEYGNMAYCVNGAGHNAVYRLLQDPNIDFFLSPQSYGVRAPGEPNADMKVFGSIIAAGKFSILEDDSRTHLTTPADHHQTINAEQTRNTLRRNWGMSLARRQPICMLPIHEGRDFSSPEVRQDLAKAQAMGQKLFESNRPSGVEIAVVVDEKSLKYLRPDSNLHRVNGITHYRYSQDGRLQVNAHSEQNITGPLMFFQRFSLARIGAGADYIYLRDVPRLADRYKLFIFLADFAANKELEEAVAALKERNVTALIAYGAGFTGKTKDVDAELMSQIWDMQFKRTSAGPLKINIDNTSDFAPGELARLTYGPDYATDPRFSVVDPAAKVLGRYADNNEAALAVKQIGKLKVVFSGSTHLTADLMRAVARQAGVFINVSSSDNLFAGYGIYSLNTVSAGRKTVKFPRAVTVKDVFTGKILGRNVKQISLDMPAHTSCVMFAE